MQGSRRVGWGVLIGFLAGIAALAPTFASFDPADAAQRTGKARATKKAATKRPPAPAPSKDAAIVVDGVTGRVLYSRNPDAPRFPASLTKMMTLYVLFEALDKGSLSLSTQLVTSSYAAGVYPTKLGLKPGETISVDLAIKAVAVLSANDAAVVVAEGLSGNESRFADRMTAKARAIGMDKTTFQNASGLPNPRQITTASDMALLGRRLAYDYPQYYHYFATPSFEYKKRVYNTHDHLLEAFSGTDGIKTGYTRASGFNLVSSVVRENKHLVGVVLGGISVPSRDREMMRILAEGFDAAAKNPTLVAQANVPWRGGRPPFTNPFRSAPTPAATVVAGRAMTTQPAQTAAAAPTEAVIPVDVVSVAPDLSLAPETAQQITITLAPTPDLVQSPLVVAQGDVAEPSIADATVSIADATVGLKRWVIQIGAFASAPIAEAQLVAYARQAIDLFAFSQRYVLPIEGSDGQTLYRARFGLFGEDEARDICKQMMDVGRTCFATLAAQ
jgi:D-alanyl-D-alanine carboxypeptidase